MKVDGLLPDSIIVHTNRSIAFNKPLIVLFFTAKNVAVLYENIATSSPTQENLSAAFFAHLKAKDLRAMQALALKAFRATKNATWVMFSVVTRVLSAGELDLKLAHGMFSKIEAKSKEDIELETHMLAAQNKFQDVLNLLNTPLASQVLMKSDLLSRKVHYSIILNKQEEALSLCKEWILEQYGSLLCNQNQITYIH
jgi:hypothetical protein